MPADTSSSSSDLDNYLAEAAKNAAKGERSPSKPDGKRGRSDTKDWDQSHQENDPDYVSRNRALAQQKRERDQRERYQQAEEEQARRRANMSTFTGSSTAVQSTTGPHQPERGRRQIPLPTYDDQSQITGDTMYSRYDTDAQSIAYRPPSTYRGEYSPPFSRRTSPHDKGRPVLPGGFRARDDPNPKPDWVFTGQDSSHANSEQYGIGPGGDAEYRSSRSIVPTSRFSSDAPVDHHRNPYGNTASNYPSSYAQPDPIRTDRNPPSRYYPYVTETAPSAIANINTNTKTNTNTDLTSSYQSQPQREGRERSQSAVRFRGAETSLEDAKNHQHQPNPTDGPEPEGIIQRTPKIEGWRRGRGMQPPTSTHDSISQYPASGRTWGNTLGTAAKYVGAGAGLYAAYRLCNDPSLVSQYVNAKSIAPYTAMGSEYLSTARDTMSNWGSGIGSGVQAARDWGSNFASTYIPSDFGTAATFASTAGAGAVGGVGISDTVRSAIPSSISPWTAASAVSDAVTSDLPVSVLAAPLSMASNSAFSGTGSKAWGLAKNMAQSYAVKEATRMGAGAIGSVFGAATSGLSGITGWGSSAAPSAPDTTGSSMPGISSATASGVDREPMARWTPIKRGGARLDESRY